MNKKLISLLVCPKCKGELVYRRRKSELWCLHDRLAYPVRHSIPVLLEMDARPLEDNEA